jgi:hypothetical protein
VTMRPSSRQLMEDELAVQKHLSVDNLTAKSEAWPDRTWSTINTQNLQAAHPSTSPVILDALDIEMSKVLSRPSSREIQTLLYQQASTSHLLAMGQPNVLGT